MFAKETKESNDTSLYVLLLDDFKGRCGVCEQPVFETRATTRDTKFVQSDARSRYRSRSDISYDRPDNATCIHCTYSTFRIHFYSNVFLTITCLSIAVILYCCDATFTPNIVGYARRRKQFLPFKIVTIQNAPRSRVS